MSPYVVRIIVVVNDMEGQDMYTWWISKSKNYQRVT